MSKTKNQYKSLGKNYFPQSMSFMMGFLGSPCSPRFEGKMMYFSSEIAKQIVKDLNPIEIYKITAGLDGDFTENNL